MSTSSSYSQKRNATNANPDGTIIGQATSDKIGFYGLATAISQRASSWQATSVVGTASSADITSDVKACLIEVMATLTACSLWKGSA